MAAEKERARLSVFAVVDDDQKLLALRAPGRRLDDVIRQVVADVVRATRLNLPEGYELIMSCGSSKRPIGRVQIRVGLAVSPLP